MPEPAGARPEADDEAAELRRRGVAGARSYAEYSGMAIQMIVILVAGVYAGKWLDERFATQTPWYTLGCSLVAIALALYVPLRGILRE